MALIESSGTTETAAERNARLQAAFDKKSTSTKRTNYYVPATQQWPPKQAESPAAKLAQTFTTPTAATQTASPGFVRRPIEPPAPAPAPAQQISLAGPLGWTVPTIPTLPYQDERQYDLSSRFGTPQEPDIEQRRYTLPQFGERKTEFDNTLEHRQLVEAARLTGDAMFTYGQLPSVISTDVARELPYNPTSKLFQDVMQESFGVSGFETPDEFLTRLGYIEFAPGQWEIQDPITVTGYGDGAYQGGGTTGYPYTGASSYSPSRGSGYSTGSALVNWRI